jgi:hypothetical protein
VKLARFRRPKASCSLSSVQYRPNTNAALRNILLTKWRSGMREVGQKKETKKVNMVDVLNLYTRMNIEFSNQLKLP